MRKMTTLVKPVMCPANLNVFIYISLSLSLSDLIANQR